MLPKIDVHAGRGAPRRDYVLARDGEPSSVVPLPRLRLLKQVGGEEQQLAAVVAPQRKLLYGADADASSPRLGKMGTPDGRPGSNQQVQRRGRGLLRPLDAAGEARLLGRTRSPPPQPRAARGRSLSEDEDVEVEGTALLLQQRARERVKQERKQRRRVAKEEEERKQQEEQERLDRAQKNAGSVEAHRRELARNAAERARRLREDREVAEHEREELQSARRERIRRYETPDKIRELRHKDHRDGNDSGSSSEVPGDQLPETCGKCGNMLMADSNFCRNCGAKRLPSGRAHPGGRSGVPRSMAPMQDIGAGAAAGPRRAARAPSADPQSRRARRRRSEDEFTGQQQRGIRSRRGASKCPSPASGEATVGAIATPSVGEASTDAGTSESTTADSSDGSSCCVSQSSGSKDVGPDAGEALRTPSGTRHDREADHRSSPVSASDSNAVAKVRAPRSSAEAASLPVPKILPHQASIQNRLQAALTEAWASGALASIVRSISNSAAPDA